MNSGPVPAPPPSLCLSADLICFFSGFTPSFTQPLIFTRIVSHLETITFFCYLSWTSILLIHSISLRIPLSLLKNVYCVVVDILLPACVHTWLQFVRPPFVNRCLYSVICPFWAQCRRLFPTGLQPHLS